MGSLEKFATKLVAKNHFVKASFGGFAGAGKTRTASEFIAGCYKDFKINKPLLIIDNEKGSRFLIPFFNQNGIEAYSKDTTSLADVLEAMKLLNNNEIGFLFIDSLSKIWYKYVNDYKSKNHKTFMTLQDWGKILPAWQSEFSDKFVDLNGNCVFTGRGGYTYDMEENEETGKKEFQKSGVKMKLAGETPFEPDINVWMELQQEIQSGKLTQWREAQILKDRSSLIDGKVFKNPTYKDFKPVIDYLVGVPIGDVAGVSDSSNIAPAEEKGYFENKRNREIEIEKFWAEFGWLGTSKDDKECSNEIFLKVTGTKSKTEFENFPLSQLNNCRVDVEQIMKELKGRGDLSQKDKIKFIKEFSFNEDDNNFNPDNPLNL